MRSSHTSSRSALLSMVLTLCFRIDLALYYPGIHEKDCTSSECTQCITTTYVVNQCLQTQTHGTWIVTNCSTSGDLVNEYTFVDADCEHFSGYRYQLPTNTCQPMSGQNYCSLSCASYTKVLRSDCGSDKQCGICQEPESFQAGLCIPGPNNESSVVVCSPDGKTIHHQLYNGSACATLKENRTIHSGQCTQEESDTNAYSTWNCSF
jgi:hypothetical protein